MSRSDGSVKFHRLETNVAPRTYANRQLPQDTKLLGFKLPCLLLTCRGDEPEDIGEKTFPDHGRILSRSQVTGLVPTRFEAGWTQKEVSAVLGFSSSRLCSASRLCQVTGYLETPV